MSYGYSVIFSYYKYCASSTTNKVEEKDVKNNCGQ